MDRSVNVCIFHLFFQQRSKLPNNSLYLSPSIYIYICIYIYTTHTHTHLFFVPIYIYVYIHLHIIYTVLYVRGYIFHFESCISYDTLYSLLHLCYIYMYVYQMCIYIYIYTHTLFIWLVGYYTLSIFGSAPIPQQVRGS